MVFQRRWSIFFRRREINVGIGLALATMVATGGAIVDPSAQVSAAAASGSAELCGQTTLGQNAARSGLVGAVNQQLNYVAPLGTAAISGSSSLGGFPAWYTYLANLTASSVSNPSMTISTGYNPSAFNVPITGGSLTCSLPSISAGETIGFPVAGSSDIVQTFDAPGFTENFSSGINSSLSVSPATVPIGGATVTVTVTVDITDPAEAGSGMHVGLGDGSDSATADVVSLIDPTNLNQGETVDDCLSSPCSQSTDPYATWSMNDPQPNKSYVFVAKVNVANPAGPSAQPWQWTPYTDVGVTYVDPSVAPGPLQTSSITVPVHTLDGPTPGAGSVSFSVGTGADSWTPGLADAVDDVYPGTPYPPQLPEGVTTSDLGDSVSGTTWTDRQTSIGTAETQSTQALSHLAPTVLMQRRASPQTTRLLASANVLPSGTSIRVTSVKPVSAMLKALPRNTHFVLATGVSWIGATGSIPSAKSDVTLTITNHLVTRGDIIYEFMGKRLTRFGGTTRNHVAVIKFKKAATFIVASKA